LPRFDAGALRAILAIVLFAFLLLRQLSELGEYIDRRRARAAARRAGPKA
jgi:flagellar biogenesis protein FliO